MSASVVPESARGRTYQEYLTPQRVALRNLLATDVDYERCSGCEPVTKDGCRILDYLSGHCGDNTGYNHPYIVEAPETGAGQIRSGDAAEPCPSDRWRVAIRDVVELADTSAAFWDRGFSPGTSCSKHLTIR